MREQPAVMTLCLTRHQTARQLTQPTMRRWYSAILSDVHLKYSGYRPDLGQTQEVHAVWGSPRSWQVDITSADDTNTVYRSFTGSGTAVSVIWDGLDSNGQDLSPQRIVYVIYDLGQARNEHEPTHSFRRSDFDPVELWAISPNGSGNAVPLALYPPGFDTNGFTIFEASWLEHRNAFR